MKATLIKNPSSELLSKLAQHEQSVFGQAGLDEWSLGYLIRHGRVYLLEDDYEVMGLAELIRDFDKPDTAFLIGLSIKSEKQNQGLGSYFLEELIREISNSYVSKVILTVDSKNHPAVSFYKKNGFIQFDQIKDYYGQGKDRLLFKRHLPPACRQAGSAIGY
ncbi:MAG: GNAT family N-acetyltransferase [Actinobacteria bacterium]|nr:MAG: GNAT family N-acetyltransferase [Actinomycetota bacterium]